VHGVMVLHGCFIISNKVCILNDLMKFSLLLSGLCHDVAHSARTN